MLPKSLPKSPAMPELADVAAGQRDLVRAEGERPSWPLDLSHRRERLHGSRIAVHEIEDPMAAGIHPGNEGGPRNRALRRDGGGQPVKGAALCQARKIRQILPVLFDKTGVHGIHSEDDDALCRAATPVARE